MIYLVEGLNYAGKSTWIKKIGVKNFEYGDCVELETSWLNRLREECTYKVHRNIDAYWIGSYLSTFNTAKLFDRCFWHRTFISALAYDSITQVAFKAIVNNIDKNSCQLIYIDTDPIICINRWKMDKNKRNYLEYQDNELKLLMYWKTIKYVFDTCFNYMEDMGFKIERIENYGS